MNKSIVFLFCLISVSSCCWPEKKYDNFYTSLTEIEKSVIAYQEGQKIGFRHSNGYEFDLEVMSVKSGNYNTSYYGSDDESCGGDNYFLENYTAELLSDSPFLNAVVAVTANDSKNYFFGENFQITVNGYGYSVSDTLESVELDGIEFENVFLFGQSSDSLSIVVDTILYTVADGIIQIRTSDNESFTIKK